MQAAARAPGAALAARAPRAVLAPPARRRLLSALRPRATSSPGNADAGGADAGADPPPPPGARAGALAVPASLRAPGAVFVMAGFLKLLVMCFPFSPMAVSMFLQGRADLGPWAVLKMLPLALGLLLLAKRLVDEKVHERRWAGRAVAAAGLLALVLSRWAFARPRPSPLDPMFRDYARQRRAAAAGAAADARRGAGGAAAGRAALGEPGNAARAEVELRARGRGRRFE
jgi:hypothetical protein